MYQKQRTTKSYSITSPYMELLQSKKKVYGLKYHSSVGSNASHSKSINNQNTANLNSSSVKGRPASSSLASHHNKSGVKSNSSQKVKSTKTQNGKKKRIYTQQAQNIHQINSDPKLHDSLFVNIDKNQMNEFANKSLFHGQNSGLKNNYINNFDFLKKFSQFNAQLKDKHNNINFSGSKSQKSNKSNKSKGKRNKHSNNPYKSSNFDSINIGKSIQQLGLTQIQDLIMLIDNCVEQANQYISFLSNKVQSLKNQLMKCKTEQFQLQRIIKQKNQQIQNKDQLINKLKKQIQTLKVQKSNSPINMSTKSQQPTDDHKTKQMKKILEVLNEMNQQNNFLQSKIKKLEQQLKDQKSNGNKDYRNQFVSKEHNKNMQFFNKGTIDFEEQDYLNDNIDIKNKIKQRRKSSNSKDIYNQIHNKIDILNISIDNNKKSTHNNTTNYASSSSPNYQNQVLKSQNKKYKFIKPKTNK